MIKKATNKGNRDTVRAATVEQTAKLTGVSKRSVRRVIAGEQENETVMNVFMELTEGRNRLLEEVKKLIPFI